MNIVSKRVLAAAAVLVTYACATPVDISGDVLLSDPSDFGDAGVFAGAGGGDSAGSGGGVGGNGGTPQGGTGGSGAGSSGNGGTNGGLAGTGNGTAGTSQVGLGGSAPLGGTGGTGGAGGNGAAGTGGTTQGGGAGGGAGTGGATATAGTGGVAGEPVFDANACDFEDVGGCEDLTCEQACPPNSGTYCQTSCEALLTCVSTDAACSISEADPLCAARNGGATSACTGQADSAGGSNSTNVTSPAFIARQFVECVCSNPRPQ